MAVRHSLRLLMIAHSYCAALNRRLVTIDARPNRIRQLVFCRLSLHSVLRERRDLGHCWEEPYVIAGGQVAWWCPPRIPLTCFTAQNIAKRYPPPFSAIEWICAERAARCLPCGEAVAQTHLKRCRSGKSYRVIPFSVDVELFRLDAEAGGATRTHPAWNDEGRR